MLEILTVASSPEWVDEKPLVGEAAHHVRYQVEQEDMSKLASGIVQHSWKEVMSEMTLQIDVWLAAEDLMLRQMTQTIGMILELTESAKVQGDIVFTIRYDEINRPVRIEAPADTPVPPATPTQTPAAKKTPVPAPTAKPGAKAPKITVEPGLDANGYVMRAVEYSKARDIDTAIAYLGKAIELKPDMLGAHSARGTAYFQSGKYGLAAADYTAEMRLVPPSALLYLMRAQVLHR